MTMIRDGRGTGNQAHVTDDGLLETNAVTEAEYGFISRIDQRAYVIDIEATPDGTTNNVLIITNDSTTYDIVVTEVQVSSIQNCTFSIKFDQTYTSGGATVTPVNTNRTSSKTSNVTAYFGDDLTLGGTAVDFATYLCPAFNTEVEPFYDAVILGSNDSVVVSANAAGGTVYVTVKFYEREIVS